MKVDSTTGTPLSDIADESMHREREAEEGVETGKEHFSECWAKSENDDVDEEKKEAGWHREERIRRDRNTRWWRKGRGREAEPTEAGRDLILVLGGSSGLHASGGKGERSVLSLKRDRLFCRGAHAVASRGLYLPVEGYWFSSSLHHTPQAARKERKNRERGREIISERETQRKKRERKRSEEKEKELETEKGK